MTGTAASGGSAAARDDPAIRDRVSRMTVRAEELRRTARRARVETPTDHPLRLPRRQHLRVCEFRQELAASASDVPGPSSTLHVGDPKETARDRWVRTRLAFHGFTNAAGSNEKTAASVGAAFCTDPTVTLHGGIGFTREWGAHIRFERPRHGALVRGDGPLQRRYVADRLAAGVQ